MKRCETCEHWVLQYMYDDKSGFTDKKTFFDEQNIKTNYGECKKVATEGEIWDIPRDNDICGNLMAGKVEMFVDVDGQCEAQLCTHKNHCCKCWQRKEG